MPTKPRDPIWALLHEEGRSLVWLARKTEYSYQYIRHMSCGFTQPTANFAARVSRALKLPASALFLPRAAKPGRGRRGGQPAHQQTNGKSDSDQAQTQAQTAKEEAACTTPAIEITRAQATL